jgi:cell division protease FtsH
MTRDKQGWRVAPASVGRGMPDEHKPKPPHRLRGFWLFVLVLLVLNWASVLFVQPASKPRVQVPFSPYFLNQLQAGQVKFVTSKGDTVQGTFARKVRYLSSETKAVPTTLFATEVSAFWNTNQLTDLLRSEGVQVNAQSTTTGTSLLAEILLGVGPTLLLVGLLVLLAPRALGAGAGGLGWLGQFGRSQARGVDPEKIRVTFDDVAGIDEAKAELTEIADFLGTPERYERLGGRMPHGVLLFGPPAPARRSWRGPWRARRRRRPSPSRRPSSSRRLLESAPRGCQTCSPRPRRRPRRSSSSTSSTRSGARAKVWLGSPAPTTGASRPWIRS